MAEPESTTQQQGNEGEPEWFAKALELAGTGKGAEEIADAVEKAPSTVRRLIKRKTESGEFTPPSAATPGGLNPIEPPEDEGGGTVSAEQAARLEALAGDSAGDDPEPEMFPMGSVDGDGLALKHLIRPGQDVSYTISVMSAEVDAPREGGLLKPDQEAYLLMPIEPVKYIPVPQKEGERGARSVTGWKIRQQVRPLDGIQRIKGDGGVVQAEFRALMAQDQAKAGQLLDQLQAAYREALAR